MRKVLFKTKIDFEALEAWRDEERDNIPPIGFLSVYKALGIVTEIDKYCKEHEDFKVMPDVNIFCNLSTHRRLKKFLEDIWSTYSLKITADNTVAWDTKKWKKGKKHYAKSISGVIKNSLIQDFANYAPGIDDELGVNEIIFAIDEPDAEEVADEVVPEEKEN